MRTYGRTFDDAGEPTGWVVVESTPQTGDDLVWATTVCQAMALNLNESPFYSDVGLPARQSVIQQIAPDFYVMRMQQRFAQYFASLVISRVPAAEPAYRVNITTHQGVTLSADMTLPR